MSTIALSRKIWYDSRLSRGNTMSSQPIISGMQVVAERRDQHRHRHPEDHHRAVVGDERVVLARRDAARSPARCMPGNASCIRNTYDEEAADQRHEHAGEQVLHADDLVVGRTTSTCMKKLCSWCLVLVRVVVDALRRPSAASDIVLSAVLAQIPYRRRPGGTRAGPRHGRCVASHASWSAGVSTKMRAGMRRVADAADLGALDVVAAGHRSA